MQLTDILTQMGGLQSMARELGVSEDQAASGAAALLPAVLGGFKKQAQAQPTGLEGLGALVGKLGGGSLLEDVMSAAPTNVNRGNDVLGQIFGSKDVSRTVAQNASAQTGLDPSVLKKMLPMLAMVVAGYMANQKSTGASAAAPQAPSSGGLGGMLGGLLGGLGGGSASSASSAASSAASGGGLASMLDMNGDGNALDDIMRMAGKFMK